MSQIIAIGTALPAYRHEQMTILQFMQKVYAPGEAERRKMRFLYAHCGIRQRYSVLPDYGLEAGDWTFYPATENLEPFPTLEQRMAVYNREAPALSVAAIHDCLQGRDPGSITHLITVTCTGLSAPGLDLQIAEAMGLSKNLVRTSVNFMGCYAAIHALKLAHAFCTADNGAKVMIVCTELCTLHFQREPTIDNIASSLLFGDGAAAVLVTADGAETEGLHLDGFHSEIVDKGKKDMAWELSSTGFLMTLSGYVPDMIESDFHTVVEEALDRQGWKKEEVTHWCIHPGGKRILEAIEKGLKLEREDLSCSYEVLSEFGNLSSATILFVLKRMLENRTAIPRLFGAAFGPGLTVETFCAHA